MSFLYMINCILKCSNPINNKKRGIILISNNTYDVLRQKGLVYINEEKQFFF